MATVRRVTFFSLLAGILLIVCKFGTDSGGSAVSVKSLQIKDEVSQWAEVADGFKPFNSLEGLTTIMNGGADEYFNRGAVEGFVQDMAKSGTEFTMESRIMDFGTAENAKNIFLYMRENA